jgi:hypothetical protein
MFKSTLFFSRPKPSCAQVPGTPLVLDFALERRLGEIPLNGKIPLVKWRFSWENPLQTEVFLGKSWEIL